MLFLSSIKGRESQYESQKTIRTKGTYLLYHKMTNIEFCWIVEGEL